MSLRALTAEACNPLVPITCVQETLGASSGLVTNPFADAMREGATWVMQTTLGWWVDVPAIDLATSPATTIRGYVLWLSLGVATMGMMWQGLLLTVSRRPEPLVGIARGLATLALWSAIGIAAPAAALRAGDEFASWVLDQAADGRAADRLMQLGSLAGVDSAGAVIVLGLLLMFSGIAQAIVMIFREGAVVVLAGVVVLAASGSFTSATRPWLHRVLAWMAALIAYKSVAALVYATAVAMIGEGNDPRTIFVGLTMMLLAILALPALMKFFTWATGSIASGGGGGMALLGMTASGASAAAALHSASGTGGASAQASSLRQDLGPPTTPPPVPPALPPTGAGAASPAGAPASTGAAAAASGGAAAAAGAGAATGGTALAALAVAQAAVSAARQASDAASRQMSGEDPA